MCVICCAETFAKRRQSRRIKDKRDSQARQLSRLKKCKLTALVSSDSEEDRDGKGKGKRKTRPPHQQLIDNYVCDAKETTAMRGMLQMLYSHSTIQKKHYSCLVMLFDIIILYYIIVSFLRSLAYIESVFMLEGKVEQ
jgi:hypothetical protein